MISLAAHDPAPSIGGNMCQKKSPSLSPAAVIRPSTYHTRSSLAVRILVDARLRDKKAVAQASGASRTTVLRWLREAKQPKTNAATKKRGRPARLSDAARDSLERIAERSSNLSNLQMARRLQEKGHPLVSPSTIARELWALDMVRKMPSAKPLLTPAHKERRLAWCQANRDRDWSRVVFSDEATLRFAPFRPKLLMKKGKQRKVVPTTKHPPSLMVWGGITSRGATPMAPITGIINSDVYQDVLMDYLVPTMSIFFLDGFVFQQDNAPPHVSRSTRAFFGAQGIEVMDWPPQSPDLNPIENLWGILKKEFAPRKGTTVAEWEQNAVRLWDGILVE